MIVEINGHDDLVRDISSGAILNTNRTEYENYVARRDQLKKQKELSTAQTDEINNIKNELAEIKQMLKALIRD